MTKIANKNIKILATVLSVVVAGYLTVSYKQDKAQEEEISAICLEEDQEFFPCIEAQAEAGDANAQNDLGYMYSKGQGVLQD